MQASLPKKIILGIDPGTVVMGFGLIEVNGSKITLLQLGVLQLHKYDDPLDKLKKIFDRVSSLCSEYQVTDLAVEAPFYGKNVQSMLKLGRAQGVAIVAGLSQGAKVYEYLPKKVKQSVTGRGAATKEQVALMLKNLLNMKAFPEEQLDATDALAVAVCHFFQNKFTSSTSTKFNSWKDFINTNPGKINTNTPK